MQGSNQSENEVKTKNERLKEIEEKKDNTILVAEDNTINRELILDQLTEAGFHSILLAANGKEAVDLALKHSPDLILMDIRMPVMDGCTAIARLKKKGYNGLIIILSAITMKEDMEKGLQAGAAGYITKPIDFDRFFLQIGKFLKVKTGKNKSKMHQGSGYQYPLKSDSTPGFEYKITDGISEKVRNIFLKDAEEKLELITGILETGDFEDRKDLVKTVAHGYVGNAGYLGLFILEATAKKLDRGFLDNASIQTLINRTMELAAILKRIIEENNTPNQPVVPG